MQQMNTVMGKMKQEIIATINSKTNRKKNSKKRSIKIIWIMNIMVQEIVHNVIHTVTALERLINSCKRLWNSLKNLNCKNNVNKKYETGKQTKDIVIQPHLKVVS